MKILAMTNTYYMLLVIIQLRTTIYKDDEFDLICTDACANSEDIFKKIIDTQIFNKVQYLKLGDLSEEKANKLKKFYGLFRNLSDSEKALRNAGLNIDNFYYDRFLCYVAGRVEEQIVYNTIRKYNSSADVELYEESYVSYYAPNGIMSIENKTRGWNQVKLLPGIMSIIGKSSWMIINNIRKAWYFEPTLVQYSSNFEICSIPKLNINTKEVINKLNYIFDYNSQRTTFNVDVLFLEDSWHMKSSDYGDLKLVRYLYENLKNKKCFMVKLHPRTRTDRFGKLGIKTNSSTVPLELIILNSGGKNNLYLSIGSGAPLVCLANFEMKNKVIMLYKCCDGIVDALTDQKFSRYIKELKNRYPDQLFIPNNISELRKLIEAENIHGF